MTAKVNKVVKKETPEEITKARVMAAFQCWRYRLGLNWWEITAYLLEDAEDIRRTFNTYLEGGVVLAEVTTYWQYTSAVINFNIPALVGKTEEEIERTVMHELIHILVNEMREKGSKHEERVVTSLTKAFKWTEADVLEVSKSKGAKA